MLALILYSLQSSYTILVDLWFLSYWNINSHKQDRRSKHHRGGSTEMDSQRDNNSDTEKSDPDSKPSKSRASSSKWACLHFSYYILWYIAWIRLLPFYITDELVTEGSQAWIHKSSRKKIYLSFFPFFLGCNGLSFICREGFFSLSIYMYLPVILTIAAVSFNSVYRLSIMNEYWRNPRNICNDNVSI